MNISDSIHIFPRVVRESLHCFYSASEHSVFLYYQSIQIWSIMQGSHASWKVLNFFLKFPEPGKSWKMILVLESSGIYLSFNLTNTPFMYRTPCVSINV